MLRVYNKVYFSACGDELRKWVYLLYSHYLSISGSFSLSLFQIYLLVHSHSFISLLLWTVLAEEAAREDQGSQQHDEDLDKWLTEAGEEADLDLSFAKDLFRQHSTRVKKKKNRS